MFAHADCVAAQSRVATTRNRPDRCTFCTRVRQHHDPTPAPATVATTDTTAPRQTGPTTDDFDPSQLLAPPHPPFSAPPAEPDHPKPASESAESATAHTCRVCHLSHHSRADLHRHLSAQHHRRVRVNVATVDQARAARVYEFDVKPANKSSRSRPKRVKRALGQLITFPANALDATEIPTLIDSGADSTLLNIDRFPPTSVIDRSHPVELKLSGAIASASSPAWTIPEVTITIAGVQQTLHDVVATSMPALEFGLIVGKPHLAQADCFVGHHQNAVFFRDGSVWCQNPKGPPSSTWTPRQPATVKSPFTNAIPKAAADRGHRLGTGQLYSVRVDLSQVTGHTHKLDPDEVKSVRAMAAVAATTAGDVSLTENQQKEADALREEFADISSAGPLPHHSDHHRHVGHHPIDLEPGATKSFKHRPPPRMSEPARMELRKQLQYLVEHGFLRPSTSPIASLVFFVPKKGGSLRMVVDYRELNRLTAKDRYPNPDMARAVDKASGHTFYTTIDLVKGFWQVPLRKGDEWKTAISTPLGLWEWTVMPFGLVNSPATFNRVTQTLFGAESNHADYCSAFVDDLAVYSDTWSDHVRHVRAVLTTLREAQLFINLGKTVIGATSVTFLGSIISKAGRSIDPARTAAVTDWAAPRSYEDVRSFLGLTGYLAPYIPGYAEIARPLYQVRSGKSGSGGHQPSFTSMWGDGQSTAFANLKRAVAEAPTLQAPDFNKPFLLQTDASDHALGAALLQLADGDVLRPVAYASRALRENEPTWPVHDRELEAIRYGIRQFEPYLQSSHFTVIVDHKPLLHIRAQPKLSARQLRALDDIAQYDFEMVYRRGTSMHFADFLSRDPAHRHQLARDQLTADLTETGCNVCAQLAWDDICEQHADSRTDASLLTFETMTTAEAVEPELATESIVAAYQTSDFTRKIIDALATGDNVFAERYYITSDGLLFARPLPLSDPNCTKDRLVLPPSKKEGDEPSTAINAAIKACHCPPTCGHLGAAPTYQRVRARFWFPRMWAAVKDYVRRCQRCQLSRSSTLKPLGQAQPLEPPGPVPGADLSTDFTFGLPPTYHPLSGNVIDGVQAYVCRLTRRVRLLPVPSTISSAQSATVYRMEVQPHWGQMRSLVSDRDPRFTAELWKELQRASGNRLKMSSARHPQTDGQSEQLFAQLGVMIRAFAGAGPINWVSLLPELEFAINTARSPTRGGLSPFEAWQGFNPIEAADLISPHVANTVAAAAKDRINQARVARQVAQDSIRLAQESTALATDMHRRSHTFAPGDLVTVSRIHMSPPGQTTKYVKAADRYVGPFPVVEMIGSSAARVLLPRTFSQHPVFHLSALKPWITDPNTPDPVPAAIPPQVDDDGSEQYSVGRIVSTRVRRGSRTWLVDWRGFTAAYRTWEPLQSFVAGGAVTHALKLFERQRTGSDAALSGMLHASPLHNAYDQGEPGTTTESKDAFELTFAFQGETPATIAHRSNQTLKQILVFNAPCLKGLRKTTKLPEGTPIRVRPVELHLLASRPNFFVAFKGKRCRMSGCKCCVNLHDVSTASKPAYFAHLRVVLDPFEPTPAAQL